MTRDLATPWRERFSLNQATGPRWNAVEVVEASARAGLRWVGLWRDPVAEVGLPAVRKALEHTGLAVSSLCRGGWFGASTPAERRRRLEDNFRAVDEAAALDAETLVLVVGPPVGESLSDARRRVADAVAQTAAYAKTAGVRLSIEPLHPTYCADRSVIVSLAQALSLARANEGVGGVLGSYHLWWDPELPAGVEASAEHIHGLQLADWLSPPPDHLNGRGMPGDGCIDIAGFVALGEAAGYRGPIEVEVFNPTVWARDPQEVLDQALDGLQRHVAVVLESREVRRP